MPGLILHRRAAAIVSMLYILVQAFQSYVFAQLPVPAGPAQELLLGAAPLNVARALLMLLSFFAQAYLFLVVCVLAFRRAPLAAVAAYLGFFAYCLIEVLLRSVELFHGQLASPELYQAASSHDAQVQVLMQLSVFQSVQRALYFPLMLAQALGSLVLACCLGGGRLGWLASCAFGLNTVRLSLRMFGMYLMPTPLDPLLDRWFLAFVVAIFGSLALWLWPSRPPSHGDAQGITSR